MKIQSLVIALAATLLLPAFAQAKPDGERPETKGDRPSPQAVFEKLDADASGTLSQDEAKGPLAKNFDKIDADSDGEITRQELAKAGKAMQQRRKKDAEASGSRFQEMDADNSGTISKSEAGERLLERFDQIDENGDGELSKEEMQAAREKMRQRRKEQA